jgi:hypothetical protein
LQFNRERVPEGWCTPRAAAPTGLFEVTEDVTDWTRASFLSEIGKRTPVFVRFSTVAGELGSPDTNRDPRGFAVKMYTDEGNFDLVCNNTPVFLVRDASKFQDFIHSQKRMPEMGEWGGISTRSPASGRGPAGHRLDTNLNDLGGQNGTGGRLSGESPDPSDPDGRSGLHGRASGA